jgi:type IV pilus assembly protein PilM
MPTNPDPNQRPPVEKYWEREELIIDSIECQKVDDMSVWFKAVQEQGWLKSPETKPDTTTTATTTGNNGMFTPGGNTSQPVNPNGMNNGMSQDGTTTTGTLGDETTGPRGPGWIVQITGHHFHNNPEIPDPANEGAQYVENTLFKNIKEHKLKFSTLQQGVVVDGNQTPPEDHPVSLEELGIGHPVLINPPLIDVVDVEDPRTLDDEVTTDTPTPRMHGGMTGMRGNVHNLTAGQAKTIPMRRFDFKVQFVWIPTPPSEREAKREAEAKAKAEETSTDDM